MFPEGVVKSAKDSGTVLAVGTDEWLEDDGPALLIGLAADVLVDNADFELLHAANSPAARTSAAPLAANRCFASLMGIPSDVSVARFPRRAAA